MSVVYQSTSAPRVLLDTDYEVFTVDGRGVATNFSCPQSSVEVHRTASQLGYFLPNLQPNDAKPW